MKADLMLIGVCAFWGSSVPVTKLALEDLQELNLIAVRFLIAFALGAIVFFRKMKTDRKTMYYSVILSVNYFFVLAFMTFGVSYTTVSKAGFLTCLAGIFVPIISFLVLKVKISLKTIICALTTIIGVYLLTMVGAEVGSGINIGDILCILCSMFFAVQIILIGRFVRKADIVPLTIYHMGFVGVLSLIASFIFETPSLPTTGMSWLSVIWLSAVCSIGAGLLQNFAQKNTSETHAGIIFTLEPLFAVLLAYIFFGEILTLVGYIGCAIILASIILLEINFPKRRADQTSSDRLPIDQTPSEQALPDQAPTNQIPPDQTKRIK